MKRTLIINYIRKKRTDHISVGGFLVVESAHLGFSTWHECSYFPRFISGLIGTMLLVAGDIPVDSEASVVTL
jgi:hypothetical protein